jgi:ubiquinone/menaquinone biosynthesis C-methylase UbiE
VSDKSHWDGVYSDRAGDALSWYQAYPERSLELIRDCGIGTDAGIIDVGGGTSGLAFELLRQGFSGLWVLDISAAALAAARNRLGADAARVQWVEADITRAQLPAAQFDVWHDRAVFHFFTDPAQQAAYVEKASAAVKPGGHLVISTFDADGPEQCSGLPVARYDVASLQSRFVGRFELMRSEREEHRTPAGKLQRFRYFVLRRLVS